MFESWHALYASDLQSLWALLVAPAVFLAVRALRPAPPPARALAPELAGFVRAWCLVFAVETLLDPVATGPLVRALDGRGPPARAVMVLFVLLGDFRIFWLVLRMAKPVRPAAAPAALLTAAVPLVAYAAFALLGRAVGVLPAQALWLAHETSFLAVALALGLRWLPRRAPDRARRRFARDVLLYAGAYYALWAAADVLILAGVDAGWGLRILPNQLYYAFTVPFVWWRFFSAR